MTTSVFIIGQKKGGSTTLYNTLSQITGYPSWLPKEAQYLRWSRLKLGILSAILKARNVSYRLDGSTSYSALSNLDWFIDRLTVESNPIVFFIVRDEEIRAHSHYAHSLRNYEFSGSFDEFINSDEYLDYARPEIVIDRLSSVCQSFYWLTLDDLKRSDELLEKLCSKLGIDAAEDSVYRTQIITMNSKESTYQLPILIHRAASSQTWVSTVRFLVPKTIRSKLKYLFSSNPKPIASKPLHSQLHPNLASLKNKYNSSYLFANL